MTKLTEKELEIINSALTKGVLVRNPDNTYKNVTGIVTLFYIQQFDKFALSYCETMNPQDAKVLFFEKYKEERDTKD